MDFLSNMMSSITDTFGSAFNGIGNFFSSTVGSMFSMGATNSVTAPTPPYNPAAGHDYGRDSQIIPRSPGHVWQGPEGSSITRGIGQAAERSIGQVGQTMENAGQRLASLPGQAAERLVRGIGHGIERQINAAGRDFTHKLFRR